MLNRVILIGRLTRDPELRYTANGIAMCTFSIAVNRPYTNQAGERPADFIDIVAWRQLAENVANYMTKGRLVAVEGRLQTRTYENHAFFKLGTGHHYLVSTAAAPNLYICTNPGDHPLPTSARMFFLHSDNVAKIEFLNFHPNPPFQSLQLVFCCWSAKLKSHHLVSSGHSLQYGIHVAYPANHQLILKIIKIKTSSAG
jgi:primosomal replication protein N